MAEETKLNQDDWADKIGTHSARKGSCGCTVSPPMASICLRAGWRMGSVKDHYLHYEKAGNQHVGRIFTNIKTLFCEKATIRYPWIRTPETPVLTGVPPHFLILAQLSNMERSQLNLGDKIVNKMRKELDE